MREKIKIPRERIMEVFEKVSTKKEACEILDIDPKTLNRIMKEHGINTHPKYVTSKIEVKDYDNVFDALRSTDRPKSIGQHDVRIEMGNHDILIVCSADWHIGAETTNHARLADDIEFVRDTPNVFIGLVGDYIDNFSKRGHGGGVYSQSIPISDQQRMFFDLISEIKEKALWISQGCHDEWSYKEMSRDISKEASQLIDGYWLGFGGTIHLVFESGIEYTIYATHVPQSRSALNPVLGLKRSSHYKLSYDVGITAHYHEPSIAQEIVRNKIVTYVTCGTYKRPDRYALHYNKNKKTLPDTDVPIPGVILRSKIKQAIPLINYKDGVNLI